MWAVPLLRSYLESIRFAIRTAHDAPKWILKLTNCTGRIARWSLRLSECDFDTVHRTEIKHQAPYVLLQLNTTDRVERPLYDNLALSAIGDANDKHAPPFDVANDEHTSRSVPDTATFDDATEYNPATTNEIIRAQQQETFCLAAASQGGQTSWEFTMNEKS